MTYQPSEVADLVLIAGLGAGHRRLACAAPSTSSRSASTSRSARCCGGYVFTVAEGFVLPDLFNLIEHVCYAVAGVAFVVMVAAVPTRSRSQLERPR